MLLAELGPDMTAFPTADHLVSGRSSPHEPSSPEGRTPPRPPAKATPGPRAPSARPRYPPRSNSFLGARYKRIVKRRGRKRTLVAVGHSLLVIVWHLLNDPETRTPTSATTITSSTPPGEPATWSASSKPSATTSPSLPQPDQPTPQSSGQRTLQHALTWGIFRSGTHVESDVAFAVHVGAQGKARHF